jgi:hypothetical protein
MPNIGALHTSNQQVDRKKRYTYDHVLKVRKNLPEERRVTVRIRPSKTSIDPKIHHLVDSKTESWELSGLNLMATLFQYWLLLLLLFV